MKCQHLPATALAVAFVSIAGFGSVSPALAGETAAAPGVDDWSFQITPYLWLSGVSAEIRTDRDLPEADVEADFTDILDALDFAAMVVGEARRGRFGLIFDISYLSLSADDSTPGPLFSGVEVELDVFISTIAVAYRVVEEEDVDLDILAGARITGVDADLSFKPGAIAGRSDGENRIWADPVVGVRGQMQFGDGFFLNFYGDVGGFAVSSDLTWQAYGGLGYQFSDTFSVQAGYRYLFQDFDDGDFVYDVALHGPLIGFSFQF